MKRKEYNGEYDTFETPDNLWSGIESKLDESPKKRRPLIYWMSAGAAAILVGALGITAVLKEDPVEQKPIVASNDQAQEKTKEYSFNKIQPLESDKGQPQAIRGHQQQQETKSETKTGPVIASYSTASTFDMTTNGSVSLSSESGGTGTYQWSSSPGLANKNFKSVANPMFTSRRDKLSAQVGQIMQGDRNNLTMYQSEHEEYMVEPSHGSTYDAFAENDFIAVESEAQSTFSIDVDGASYSDVRGMINRNVLPNPNAVRLEEFINYFPYNYNEPDGDHPFSMHSEVTDCPWNGEHKLMKIGIKGESIPSESLPKNNLVFLLDVSGSMMSAEKLDLLKKGFGLLVQEMREEDKVAICVYAGAAGLVLPPTSGAHKDKIMDAINRLEAGGSTAGGQGIELAYNTAIENFDPNGNNRVILATDGDFNVGVSGDDALVEMIEEKRKSGVFLTVLGFGHDNFQSSKMEKLANNGNGNFSFIDNILEAKKVLVTEMGATLKTIAKDVKIQLDFNPEYVESYRLIGYENRMLANEDFANDAIDAGELGAGHTVTAVYEIVPGTADSRNTEKGTSTHSGIATSLTGALVKSFEKGQYAVLKFRYKQPTGTTSQLITTAINYTGKPASTDMQFISSVIEAGLILRQSKYKGTANFDNALRNAREGLGRDPYGYRSEFIHLLEKAQRLSKGTLTN